jgi:hypothetical protein
LDAFASVLKGKLNASLFSGALFKKRFEKKVCHWYYFLVGQRPFLKQERITHERYQSSSSEPQGG